LKLLGIVLLGLSMATAQSPAPLQASSADEVLGRARTLYAEEGPRAALPEFEKALALYREGKNRRGEAIVIGLMGNCHKRFGEFARAEELLQQALKMKQELGDRSEEGRTLSHLGLLYWEMGQYPKAIDFLTRAIAIGRELSDRQLEGSALNNLSLVYDELGDFKRSLEQYQKVLELYRGTNFERGESDTLGNIGGIHLMLGRYRESLHYYRQALAISERLALKPSMSQDLGNIALSHLGLGEIPEALASFDRAAALAREAGLAKEQADWQKGKGGALARLGRYGPALAEFELALASYDKAGLKRELVEALFDRGQLFVLVGDAASAERDFRRGIELARQIGHPRGVLLHLIALGGLEFRRGRYEPAGALFRDALARAREADDLAQMAASLSELSWTYLAQKRLSDAQESAEQALGVARRTESRTLESLARLALGEVARSAGEFPAALEHYAAGETALPSESEPELAWRLAYGRGRTLEAVGRNDEAVGAYERAVQIIESVRGQLSEERFRAAYLEDKYQVYVALVQLLLKLGRVEEAFRYSERLRARSYLELLGRGPAPIRNEQQRRAEAAARERIRQLQRARDDEATKPPSKQRGQALQIFSDELAEAERAYQNLLDDLRRAEPAFAALRSLAVPPTSEVQARLPRQTALVEYVVGEESLSIFVVSAEQVFAKTVPLRRADLSARVELLRDLIRRGRGEEWRAPAQGLRRLLMEPLEQKGWLQNVRRVYLVPHGILHYVPFAALVRPNGSAARYLNDDYELSYLPAAAALVHRIEARNPEGSLFALAPARSRLQFSQQEAQGIAEFFPDKRLLLAGARATETSFKRHAGDYQFVHLATHGYFNKFNPLLSGVELEADEAEDGKLEVHEILGLKLNARLVTLSACDTALGGGYFGDVPVGDDLVGLTRAVLYAGSPSVLASLWEVNDRSTVDWMRSFYGGLRNGDKAGALAKAQRQMRRNPRLAHPYYWAPFVLVGQMD
jgi:CHAT domain-containing protein/Tfp pilus assembly protein PilF